jgi:hypothetical protein
MRRWIGIGTVLLVILAGIAIGVGAYNAGVSAGVSQGLRRSGQAVEVVRVVGPGFGHGYGFFPFGLVLFPLLVVGGILLLRAAFWRGRWGGPGGPRGWGAAGPWAPGGLQRFEDWHQRQHDQAGERPGGDEPTVN